MSAPFELSLRPPASHLSRAQSGRLHARLTVNKHERTTEVERHAAFLAGLILESSADATSLDRARTALRMYTTRQAIEEIDDAFARMESGDYGICVSCARPIPFAHLEALPQARFCAGCPDGALQPLTSTREGIRGATAS